MAWPTKSSGCESSRPSRTASHAEEQAQGRNWLVKCNATKTMEQFPSTYERFAACGVEAQIDTKTRPADERYASHGKSSTRSSRKVGRRHAGRTSGSN
jgi:hypothetical protein